MSALGGGVGMIHDFGVKEIKGLERMRWVQSAD